MKTFRVELQPQDGQSQSWFDSIRPNSTPESSDFAPMANSLDIEPYQSPDYNPITNNQINNGNLKNKNHKNTVGN